VAVLRLVVADDTLLVREGVRSLLDDEPGMSVVATAADLDGLLAAVAEHRPDVVVTDVCMPPTRTDEGIRAAQSIRLDLPETGVVVLSQYDDPAYAIGLLDEGVARRAYLLKDRVGEPGQLVAAVRAVASGGSFIDPRVVEVMIGSTRKRGPLDDLTEREREVLALMATGANNQAIAERLFVTVRAVERHINSIFAKLGLTQENDYHRRVRAVLLHLSP
jgi:DNA-binding NarL/FixJ family response regulator